jgi:hypothetical protein
MNLILPKPLESYNRDRAFRIYGNPVNTDASNFYYRGWEIMRDLLTFSQENEKAALINE